MSFTSTSALRGVATGAIRREVKVLALWLAFAMCAHSQSLDGSTRADWPHYGGSQAAWRYSALDQSERGERAASGAGVAVPDRRLW